MRPPQELTHEPGYGDQCPPSPPSAHVLPRGLISVSTGRGELQRAYAGDPHTAASRPRTAARPEPAAEATSAAAAGTLRAACDLSRATNDPGTPSEVGSCATGDLRLRRRSR